MVLVVKWQAKPDFSDNIHLFEKLDEALAWFTFSTVIIFNDHDIRAPLYFLYFNFASYSNITQQQYYKTKLTSNKGSHDSCGVADCK